MNFAGGTRGAQAKPLLVVAAAFGLALAASAQTPPTAGVAGPLAVMAREVWTTREGLPHNQVNSIAQTPDGYLWLGTWEGLTRFNGVEFEVFDRVNVPAMEDSGIRNLAVGRDGALLVATSRGGLNVLRDGSWEHYGLEEGLPQLETIAVLEDRNGALWVGTESAGVGRLDGAKTRVFSVRDGLPSNVTYTLFEATDGAIWVGTASGIARIVGESIQTFDADPDIMGVQVYDLVEDSLGLVIGTQRGVIRFDGQDFRPLDAALPAIATPSLDLGPDGNLYIGTVDRGLLRWFDGELETLGSQDGLPNNRIPSLFHDREGSLWIGTNSGLMRLSATAFVPIDTRHGLSDNYVRAATQASEGGIWVGTSRGLNLVLAGEPIQSWTQADGLPTDSILSLAESASGDLWIGTYSEGAIRFRNGRVVEQIDDDDGMLGLQVRAIAETPDGTIWLGTSRGLWRQVDGVWRVLDESDGLPRQFVIALHYFAREKRLAVGTANGLAWVGLDGAVTPVALQKHNDAQDVFGFVEHGDDLWITSDRGLLRYRDGRIAAIGRADGLPIDTLFDPMIDRDDFFWLTSNRGVLRIAGVELDALADGRPTSLGVSIFSEADGLPSAQCNGGAGPASLISRQGFVWIGTARGLGRLDPADLSRHRRSPPPVAIETVRVDDQAVPMAGTLSLPAGTRAVEFDYAGLSYLLPREIRYRYRLDGFDEAWSERRDLRTARFTNLRPGDYRFRVTAAQSGSGWNPEEASVTFRVEPFLWQRQWVQFAAIVLVLLAIYGLVRLRVRALRVRERNLTQVVAERTRDLEQQTERLIEVDRDKSTLLDRLRDQSEAFEVQARTDALTKLANRRHIEDRLSAAFAHAVEDDQPMSVALLDIDHFKAVNDTYSHGAGDAALIAVATAIRACVPQGVLVGRWGGEEFAIVMPGRGLTEASVIAEKVRSEIESLDVSAIAPGLVLSASLGVAERTGLSHPERLVGRADAKLYEAKRGGRNRVCH